MARSGPGPVTCRPLTVMPPGPWFDQTGDGVDEGCLAAARRSNQHDELAAVDRQVDIAQRREPLPFAKELVSDGQAGGDNHRSRALRRPSPAAAVRLSRTTFIGFVSSRTCLTAFRAVMQTIAESNAEEWRAQAEFFRLADGGGTGCAAARRFRLQLRLGPRLADARQGLRRSSPGRGRGGPWR